MYSYINIIYTYMIDPTGSLYYSGTSILIHFQFSCSINYWEGYVDVHNYNFEFFYFSFHLYQFCFMYPCWLVDTQLGWLSCYGRLIFYHSKIFFFVSNHIFALASTLFDINTLIAFYINVCIIVYIFTSFLSLFVYLEREIENI